MAQLKEARVPDIGDYNDVPVIELLVAVGDTVAKDQGLATLESDKATMEVPAPFAGVVRELKIKLGDTLSEGAVVALIEPLDAGGGDGDKRAEPAAPEATTAAAAASTSAELLPAVCTPPGCTGRRRASASSGEGRGWVSVSTRSTFGGRRSARGA